MTTDIVERLENVYDFQCEAGPLKNCVEWQQLKAEIERLRSGRDAVDAVVEIAKECVEDRRAEYPEEPPRWKDCGCAGPLTEKLADALRALTGGPRHES